MNYLCPDCGAKCVAGVIHYCAGEVARLRAEVKELKRRIREARRLTADALERPDEDGASSIAALEALDLRRKRPVRRGGK